MSTETNNPEQEMNTSLMSEADAFGTAAAMFGTYLPRFKALNQRLSAKGRLRVMNALVEVPLNIAEFNPTDKVEKETFLVGQSLLEAKMLMIMHSYAFSEEQKMAEKPLEVITTNEEESNG